MTRRSRRTGNVQDPVGQEADEADEDEDGRGMQVVGRQRCLDAGVRPTQSGERVLSHQADGTGHEAQPQRFAQGEARYSGETEQHNQDQADLRTEARHLAERVGDADSGELHHFSQGRQLAQPVGAPDNEPEGVRADGGHDRPQVATTRTRDDDDRCRSGQEEQPDPGRCHRDEEQQGSEPGSPDGRIAQQNHERPSAC